MTEDEFNYRYNNNRNKHNNNIIALIAIIGMLSFLIITMIKDVQIENEYKSYANGNIINISKEKQLDVLKKYPYAIEHLKSPSEEHQLVIVEKDGNNIKYINNPTYNVMKIAIENNPLSIQYIENPSNELKEIYFISKNKEKLKKYDFHNIISIMDSLIYVIVGFYFIILLHKY